MSDREGQTRGIFNGLRENWPIVLGIVVLITGYVEMRTQVSDNTRKCATLGTYVDDLRLHPDTRLESRIAAIEAQKADQTAVAVQNLARVVGELTAAQRNDHDIIVRLVTLREKERTP